MKQIKIKLAAVVAIAVAAVCGTPNTVAQSLYPKPDTKTLELIGPVKQMTEYRISKKEYFTQDELNEYKRRGEKPPTTSRDFQISYTFDNRGFTTSERKAFLGDDRLTTMTYDAEGRKIRERFDLDGKFYSLYTFTYDSEGMPSDAVKVDADGKVIFTETNQVAREGDSLTQTNVHTNADGATTETLIEYWSNGEMKTFSMKSANSNKNYTFDIEGKPLTYYENRRGKVSKLRMVKDPSDSNITLIYAIDGGGPEFLYRKTINDENGNPVNVTEYGSDGTVKSEKAMEYIYDSHGNWIRKTVVKGAERYDKPEEREFIYY